MIYEPGVTTLFNVGGLPGKNNFLETLAQTLIFTQDIDISNYEFWLNIQRYTLSGWKDIGIIIFEFVAKTLETNKDFKYFATVPFIHKSEKDNARAAVVHLNFWAGSTFPPAVFTIPSSMDRTSRCNKVDAVRLYASYRLNLLY